MKYKDFYFAHTASNYRTDCSDLEFIVDGKSHFFPNVPAPEGWDGESDWTDDEEYVMNFLKVNFQKHLTNSRNHDIM